MEISFHYCHKPPMFAMDLWEPRPNKISNNILTEVTTSD